jgi:acyl-CoA hydrolase
MSRNKTVNESRSYRSELVYSSHINGAGRLFGGQLLCWIDIVGGVVAMRHASANVTTAAIDEIVFKDAAYMNDMLQLVGQVTFAATSSMEVRVDTYVENLKGERRMINQAYLVYVALDENEKPTSVPGVICETSEEEEEFKKGKARYELRAHKRNS